jgi:predicted kinase
VLDLPSATIRAQNAARERVVGDDVIDRHLAAIRRTLERDELRHEGVATVIVVRTADQARDLELARHRA